MFRLFTLVSLSLLFICSCVHQNNKSAQPGIRPIKSKDDHSVRIIIPSKWIDKLRHFNYTRDDSIQLREFEKYIKPDSLCHPTGKHVDEGYGRVFNAISVDLDSDGNDEFICVLGWDVAYPVLCVFKQEKGNWYLIYMEKADAFYGSLYVANNFSRNKVFYLRYEGIRGSGVYEDRNSFYKLINGKVYKCLDLINSAEGVGARDLVNEEVNASFEFSGDDKDQIMVSYKYNLSPGQLDTRGCGWYGDAYIPFIAGEGTVRYYWDAKSVSYKIDTRSYGDQSYELTPDKIACFGTYTKDTLFVKAFKNEINDKLKSGTSQQKKVLTKYLQKVNGKGIGN